MHFIKILLHLLALYATFQRCYSEANQLRDAKTPTDCTPSSSILFEVTGNIYPDGYYYVSVCLGDPPTPYHLDFDTGSHFTWVQCDAPCQKCLPAPHPPYKPVTWKMKGCRDPICEDIRYPKDHVCESPNEPCTYYLRYADGGSSLGVVINDPITLQYTNGTLIKPDISFGCGYHQKHPDPNNRPYVDGILGLGSGKEGILSQLRELGIIKNVVGHCFSTQGGGYLFLGDEFVPSSVVWTPMITSDEFAKRYFLGVAELYVGGAATGVRDLRVLFDSGTTFSFFAPEAYGALVSMLSNDIKEKQLYRVHDEYLPVCWRGPQPFESIEDVKNIFKPIALSFENSQNTWLEMYPEAYLIVTKDGNVCLGILDSTAIGAPTVNLIAAISFHDKLIIYDNENQKIGWTIANCKDPPQSQCHSLVIN
ncbi:aspartic peptidase A1 family [Artemisia annua]|uniref:Aspartic peptidase A1 family n=1 Tax=Artemisia annua TaxID=35608 RepID=A0A2U1KV63_ARTAN|nr:aspartic peptidase A1 family [Artemisia annua]